MKNTPIFYVVIILFTLTGFNAAHGGTKTFDKGMRPILNEYLAIHKALSGDSTAGVAKAAGKITKLAGKLQPGKVKGKHASRYKHVPMKLKKAARKLAKAKDIKAMREALKDLSKPMAMWATMSKPAGIAVVYCSMTEGSWLQKGKKIANPYYGAKMYGCGEVVGGGVQHKKGH